MFKTPLAQIAEPEKAKEKMPMEDKHGVSKSVTVNQHHDGHFSVESQSAGTHHFNAGEEDGMGPHIVNVLMEPDEDDMAEADQETAQKGTDKKGSKVKPKA